MTEDEGTIETCPKHGLSFNRAHYFACELCRGVQVAPDAPRPALELDPVSQARLKLAGAILGSALVLYLGVALVRAKLAPKPADTGPAVVSLSCVQTCTARVDECLLDCASVRDDACTAGCLPSLEHCADRCDPPLRVRDGIAVISSELPGPELDKAALAVYRNWPPSDLPERAYVRLRISTLTGKVRDAQVVAAPKSSAALVESTFLQASFPKGPADPHIDEPGRRDEVAPYVVYVVMKP